MATTYPPNRLAMLLTELLDLDPDDDTDNETLLHAQTWDIYALLLDDFPNQWFTAKQVVAVSSYNKKTVNRALHRLVHYKALHRRGDDPIRSKQYALNNHFMPTTPNSR